MKASAVNPAEIDHWAMSYKVATGTAIETAPPVTPITWFQWICYLGLQQHIGVWI